MNAKSTRAQAPSPAVPDALGIAEALRLSAPLTQLRARLQDSAARFDAIRGDLPAALTPHVKPGPVDDTGWSLLAANGAVAAKLRQLQPRLEERLAAGGWQPHAIRVKVQSK